MVLFEKPGLLFKLKHRHIRHGLVSSFMFEGAEKASLRLPKELSTFS